MKLSEFTMELFNTAEKGEAPKMEAWHTGSRSNLWGKGSRGGNDYQVKIHAAEPKWNFVEQKIAEKKQEIKECDPADELKAERLNKELSSLEKGKAKQQKRDQEADSYVEIKKHLISVIHATGDKYLNCPDDFWTEPIEQRGNGTFAVEAMPWVKSNLAFDGSAPIDFHRDLTLDQQYAVVAELCDQIAKLHQAGVFHTDLKIGNTIINKESDGFKVTLIDFDSSFVLEDLYSRKYSVNVWYFIMGGTYFAPEFLPLYMICREEKDAEAFDEFDVKTVTTKADIFSLGITIYEYFYGDASGLRVMPFIGPEGDALEIPDYGTAVEKGYKPNLPDTVDDLLYGALNWMLAKDPADRPTAQQVAEVFHTRNISLIPVKYIRNPLWEEHRSKYKVNLPEGVTLSQATKLRYRLNIRGTFVTRSIESLVASGYVVELGEDGAPKPVEEKPKTEDLSGKIWDSDGGGDLPPCVRRGGILGRYLINSRGISRGATFQQLKDEGYICSEAEKTMPWPCDKGLRFVGTRPIARDFASGKGAGCYIVGSGLSAIRYTKDMLIEYGLASTAINFNLCASDAELYVPKFDKIPSSVKAITRSAIVNHQYRLEYTDGHVERLMISDMLAKGYVASK